MELPTDIISIINDFSKPITRSNWRKLHKMTSEKFVHLLFLAALTNVPLLKHTFNKACDVITTQYMIINTLCNCRKQTKKCKCSASYYMTYNTN